MFLDLDALTVLVSSFICALFFLIIYIISVLWTVVVYHCALSNIIERIEPHLNVLALKILSFSIDINSY